MSISDLNYELRYLYNDMEKIINQIERRSNAQKNNAYGLEK